jgi:hypothetical protein
VFGLGAYSVLFAKERFKYGVVRYCASTVEMVVVHGLFVNMKSLDGVHHGNFLIMCIRIKKSKRCFMNLE